MSDDILTKLNSLGGVIVKETTKPEDKSVGYHRYLIYIEQPIDHGNNKSGSFKQKLVLFHRGFDEPMVLQTSGYSIFGEKLSRIAHRFQTNQIQVEHRHFSESVPSPMDWTKLNIKQSADDFHRVVETFKQLYKGKWVGTGASKGGMTSVFHRRFYPNDMDGTVADVAPISFALEDKRYVEFVDTVGGDKYKKCRQDLEDFQRTVLAKKSEIAPKVTGQYGQLGGVEVAIEHAVSEMPFIFWQYGHPETGKANCSNIPSSTASALEIYNFLTSANKVTEYSDETLQGFIPYFYQAANELGGPALKREHLVDLLKFPMEISMYLPKGEKYRYSVDQMKDVAEWVATRGDGLMFVYGEFDPWTAGAYRDLAKGDNHWFMVPTGNHGANFTLLKGKDSDNALGVLARWLQKSPVQNFVAEGYETIEDVELKLIPHIAH